MTDMKVCPYCDEEVKAKAKKCKHCQTMLSEVNNAPVGLAASARPEQAAPKVKKPIWKRWWVWVIVGLLVIGMFGGGNGNDEEAVDEPEEAAEEPEEIVVEEEMPVTYETLEEEVETIIIDMFGEETNTDKQRIVFVIHDEDEEGEYLQVTLNANENITTSWTRTGILGDTKELFEALYEIESDVTYISLFWALPLVDAYGNVTDRNVVIVSMDKETADKVNWDNILTDNIPVIATSYWQHGALE